MMIYKGRRVRFQNSTPVVDHDVTIKGKGARYIILYHVYGYVVEEGLNFWIITALTDEPVAIAAEDDGRQLLHVARFNHIRDVSVRDAVLVVVESFDFVLAVDDAFNDADFLTDLVDRLGLDLLHLLLLFFFFFLRYWLNVFSYLDVFVGEYPFDDHFLGVGFYREHVGSHRGRRFLDRWRRRRRRNFG